MIIRFCIHYKFQLLSLCMWCLLSLVRTDYPRALNSRMTKPITNLAKSVAFFSINSIASKVCMSVESPALFTTRNLEISINDLNFASAFIEKYCKNVLNEVRESGRLFYRGETLSNNTASLILSSPDLLSPKTHGLVASDYFSTLNNYMKSKNMLVYPQNGHLVTSNQMKASIWGPVCSIWPIDNLHTAWLEKNEEWWDDVWSTPQNPRGPFFWRNNTLLQGFLDDNLLLDQYMDGALMSGHDVMMSNNPNENMINDIIKELNENIATNKINMKTTGKSNNNNNNNNNKLEASILKKSILSEGNLFYLAIPIFYESKLLSLLNIQPYSEGRVSVRTSAQIMDLGDEPIKRRRDPYEYIINDYKSKSKNNNNNNNNNKQRNNQ